jgi:hypothetical protein
MTLPIIFIGLFVLTIALFLIKKDWAIKYKKWLIFGHIFFLVILTLDIFLLIKFNTSYRTIWIDRLFAVSFFISGALMFALYYKSLRTISKIYFGFFFFYPIIAASTFLMDRILFAIVASPLILALISPNIYYSDKYYDIRSMQGIMAPNRLVLVKKDLITETELGKSDIDFFENGNYKILKIVSQNNDSTIILIDFNGQQKNMTFIK